VANLLEILGATTGRPPPTVAEAYDTYGALKADTAEAVVEVLRPIQERLAAIVADRTVVDDALRFGAEKARSISAVTLERARAAIGLLSPTA
jgi:tryptophanyl-tRNA synthetase